MSRPSWSDKVERLRQVFGAFPDPRTGDNTKYSMEDIGLGAFSVFFMQSPSFLARQRDMQRIRGQNNAQSLFHIQKIPCDNQIRQTLDPVAPEHLFPLYDEMFEDLRQAGVLEAYRAIKGTFLLALDGTWYFSSDKIDCPRCSCLEHKTGQKTHYHSAVTPVIVAPGQPRAIPLRPEFITPQDGHTKQDCEIAASKRWLEKNLPDYPGLQFTALGDDLYSHQPFCRRLLLNSLHFILVCKPQSHKTLYDWVNLLQPGRGLHVLKVRVKNKRNQWENHTCRYANQVPLAEGDDALKVNWCELTLTDAQGEVLYLNDFITDFTITDDNVAAIVASGRARWKIENENNNTLKTKGYHLEHNFGHGRQHLSSLLAAMNILALLCHTFLAFTDENYRLIRAELATRQSFFDDLRALTRYLLFSSWEGLMDFMMRGLEIGPYAKPG